MSIYENMCTRSISLGSVGLESSAFRDLYIPHQLVSELSCLYEADELRTWTHTHTNVSKLLEYDDFYS